MIPWVTAVGAWGDTFAAVGNAVALMQKYDWEKVNILHYGYDTNIKQFLEAQPFFQKVLQVVPFSKDQYHFIIKTACSEDQMPYMWVPFIASDLKMEDVYSTHTGYMEYERPINLFCPELPESSKAWAKEFMRIAGLKENKFIILNPVSIQSAPLDFHWKCWDEAINWLLDVITCKFVIVGCNSRFTSLQHNNLVNLIDIVYDYNDILTLCNKSKLLVTTSNSLAMWSILVDKPALVCCNTEFNKPQFFHTYIKRERNELIYSSQKFADFKEKFNVVMSNL